MPTLALVGAAVAALVGALAWGFFAYATGYEMGYLAWGIGLLVGFAVARLGGRGPVVGVWAAGLPLVSIFGGKLLSTHLFVERERVEVAEGEALRPMYEGMRVDADDWAHAVDTSDETAVREFMVERGYSVHDDARRVTRKELADFHEWSVPALESLAANEPDFVEWRAEVIASEYVTLLGGRSLTALVIDDLHPFDILFAIFAVSSAFGLVSRAGSGTPGAPSSVHTASNDGKDAGSKRRAA